MSKKQGSSVPSVNFSDAALRSINEAIRASVAAFIGSLADNLTQVIKDCLSGFTKRFSEEIA